MGDPTPMKKKERNAKKIDPHLQFSGVYMILPQFSPFSLKTTIFPARLIGNQFSQIHFSY